MRAFLPRRSRRLQSFAEFPPVPLLAPEQPLKQGEMASADVDSSQSEFLQPGGAAETQVSRHFLARLFRSLSIAGCVFESMEFTRFKFLMAWGESRTLPVFPSITATHFTPVKPAHSG